MLTNEQMESIYHLYDPEDENIVQQIIGLIAENNQRISMNEFNRGYNRGYQDGLKKGHSRLPESLRRLRQMVEEGKNEE